MRSVLIRRFEISDQLTHLFNALFWAVLAATGILIGSASRANVEPTHLSIGLHFAFGFALAVLLSAYILFVKSRFQRMLFEVFRTDRPFLAWLKCELRSSLRNFESQNEYGYKPCIKRRFQNAETLQSRNQTNSS